MTRPSILQFGSPGPGLGYRARPTAFGLVFCDSRLACVRVDLPGGAIDGIETGEQAVVREFREETGMRVRPLTRIAEASQYFLKSDGEPIKNTGGFRMAEQLALDPAAKVETDHELVWLDPHEALANLRHDAHGRAVTVWLRCRVQSHRPRS